MLSWSRLFYSILQFLKSLLLTLFPSLEKENVKGKGDTACVIPESVNYHFTRQCNYNCEEIETKLISQLQELINTVSRCEVFLDNNLATFLYLRKENYPF